MRIDRIRLLEQLRSVVAAAQARETVAFAASQRERQLASGVPAGRAERGVAAQVGLARRVSPLQARRYVGWCRILTTELPGTYRALWAGAVGEWRALLVARESAWLSREHRAQVDREVAPQLSGWGNRRVEGEVQTRAYRLDPTGYLDRIRGADSARRVGLRPAPDTMARLSCLLPVTQGVASYAALRQAADQQVAAGDGRTRDQIMADTLVERLTGQTRASAVPVQVNLVMTDQSLLAGGREPARVLGYGPIPAPIARHLALHPNNQGHGVEGPGEQVRVVAHRGGCGGCSPHPDTGRLVAMESTARCFTPTQRQFIALRDQHCRTPYCDAPIRHTDHVQAAEHGGPTTVTNGQGYCLACNHNRQAPGWTVTTPTGDAGEHVEITTPTGHRYHSHPPDPPQPEPQRRSAERAPDEQGPAHGQRITAA